MATNTTVLLLVTAIAALVLAGALALVVYKARTSRRNVNGTTIRDQAEQDALRLRRQETLADEFDARAHAAQVEIDIKTVRACSLQQQATAHRSEAVSSRDQLNELREQADKLSAAGRPPAMPGLGV
jgi:cytochrome c oxidase assembly protein Cox11